MARYIENEQKYIKEILAMQEQGFKTEAIWKHFSSQMTRSTFYRILRNARSPDVQLRHKISEKLEQEVIEQIKSGNLTVRDKFTIIDEIENEISELKKMLESGYILRKVEIDGVEKVKSEMIMSSEYYKLSQLIDSKRAEVCKLMGYYMPKKLELTDAKSLEQKAPIINVSNDRYSTTARGQHSTDKH